MTGAGDFRGVLGVTVRLKSDGELRRLEVLRDLDRRRLTTEAAAQLLGLGHRQVFRLLKTYRIAGCWPDFEAAWLSEQPAQVRGTKAHNELARAFHKADAAAHWIEALCLDTLNLQDAVYGSDPELQADIDKLRAHIDQHHRRTRKRPRQRQRFTAANVIDFAAHRTKPDR